MADKAAKPKKSKSKAKKDEKGVLAALPSTRPERIGTRRTGTPVASATKTASTAAKTAKPAATTSSAKPAATTTSAKPAASAKRKAASRPTAARRKAAAPRTFEPTEAAEAAAGAADERAAGVTAERPAAAMRATTQPRPRPVREGAPGMGTTSADREQPPSPESGRPSGVELVTTAVRATGELTQIGLTIGGRILKRAVDRLPRP
jgi:hypothetical protein